MLEYLILFLNLIIKKIYYKFNYNNNNTIDDIVMNNNFKINYY